MLFTKMAEISQQLDTDRFNLLMNMIDEDIQFHKSIGTDYSEDKLMKLIDNTLKVIERV